MTKQEKKLQCIEQIKEKSKEIEITLLKKLEQIFDSGAVPELFYSDGYLLTLAIINSFCVNNPYKINSPDMQDEFDNLDLFM